MHDTREIETQDKPKPKRKALIPFALKIIIAHIIVALLILIPLGIHENRQAQRDWNAFKVHWEAKGEIFELKKLIPPQLPDEQNFAEAPIIAELFDKSKTPQIESLEIYGFPAFKENPRALDFHQAEQRQALGGGRGQLKDYFEDGKDLSKIDAAKRLLEAYQPYSSIFDQLTNASRRAGASYPIDYENPIFFTLSFPHLRGIQTAAKSFKLRSLAHLQLQQNQACVEDLITIFRLAGMAGSEPLVISHLVEITLYNLGVPPIWQLLKSRQLNQAQLFQILQSLEKINLAERFHQSIRNERASFLSYIDAMLEGKPLQADLRKEPVFFFIEMLGMQDSFFYRNKINYSLFIQEHFINTAPPPIKIDINALNRTEADLATLNRVRFIRWNPYTKLIQGVAGFKGITQTSLATATRINLARIAIALELHRIEHGTYPKTLAPLSPHYLKSLPLDLVTDNPLHYRIKTDGTPIIYSVGLNQIDEGGLLKKDHELGDWVWQYTLPEDFNSTQWRE
ncbi:MAG: hypothetical protein L3J39_09765 [Verrucomicrobiales bacterium]|nr:hypothetical protein [Verrucomicrobiales bacterium]